MNNRPGNSGAPAWAYRAVVAGALLFLGACASQPEFVHDSYDKQSADRLFAEAFDHISDNFIEPVDLRAMSVAGLNGLAEIDPSLKATASGDGFALVAGGAQPAIYSPPLDRDATGWATTLSSALATARSQSAKIGETPPDDLYTAVLTGVTGSLDAYSRYEPPKRASESRARREGYGGIGVTISDVDGKTVIQEVMPETPAARAGLLANDVITHADGVALSSMPREDRAERLRGPIGVPVAVSIAREGVAPFTVNIERGEIVPRTVYFLQDKNLPRFRISSFSRNTAETLSAAIAEAEHETGGLDGIVLDLRGNPGGYLTQAIEVADLFLDDGLVVETDGRHPSSSSSYHARAGAISKGKPIILLIDGRSASASELLAAALVDAGRAVAIGSVTYGKGSIQNLEELANGGELIITWSRMHAPSGYLLDGLGVRPTICTVSSRRSGADSFSRSAARVAREAADWRGYRTPDKVRAERLRAVCPKVEVGGDADLRIAQMLLGDRNAYKAALAPANSGANHTVAAGPYGNSG